MNDRFSADDSPTGASLGPPRSPWPIDLAHLRPFRLGQTEILPSTRQVRDSKRCETLEPRVMQVLVALASARGAILSRDDLIAACWDGRAVSDDAVNRVMSRLRALSRTFDGFAVETIIKVGYRLVEREGSTSAVVSPAGRGVDRRLAIAAAGAIALAGGAWLVGRDRPRAPGQVERLIAQARAATREGMPDDMAHAAALYRLAVEADPDSAEAWGGLSSVYRFQWEFSNPEEAPAMAARARSAASRALELDPDNGDARTTLAGLVPMFGNWSRVEAEMRPVLARHPQKIRIRYARLLSDTGRLDEALTLVRQAVDADPDIPRFQNFLGRLLQDTGRTNEARRVFEHALARWPRHLLLWMSRAYFLIYTGRPSMALSFINDRASRPVGLPEEVFDLAIASAEAVGAKTGPTIDVAVEKHLAAVGKGTAFAENAVTFCSAAGRVGDAFAILDAYFFGRGRTIADGRFGDQTATFTPPYNRQCGFLFYAPNAPLRADPRFARLVEEIGLEEYWRQARISPDYRRTEFIA